MFAVHSKFSRAQSCAVLLAATALALCGRALAVDLNRKLTFDIPAQKLSTALLQFSHQSGVQVVVGPEVGEQTTAGVNGEQSIANALSHLLEPSGLTYVLVGETSISIGKSQATKPSADTAQYGHDD